MIERRQQFRFPLKARESIRIACEFRGQIGLAVKAIAIWR
jgi:hypothetical protein